MTNAQNATLTELEDGARANGHELSTSFGTGSTMYVAGFPGGLLAIDADGNVSPANDDPIRVTPRDSERTRANDQHLLAAGVRVKRDAVGKVRGYETSDGKHHASKRDALVAADAIAKHAAEVDAAFAAEVAKIERKERKRTAKRAAAAPAKTARVLSKRDRKGSRDVIVARGLAAHTEAGVTPTIASMVRVTGLTASSVRRGMRAVAA